MDQDTPPNPDKDSSSGSQESGGFMKFWAELKRRKVMRVAMVYAVVGWIAIQVSATVFPQLGIPEWAAKLVTLVLLIGFPIALIIAWAFELSPDGIKTTKHAREEQGEQPVSKKQERKRNWMAYAIGAAAPTVIFSVLAIFFYLRPVSPNVSGGGSDSPPALSSSNEVEDFDKSIAVLPLTNMSPDPNNAFFADGVHEDILTNLSKIRDLLVIGRTSTLQYRDTVKTLKEIGDELDVRYLLEGSVRREGNQVRVTVQLIDSQNRGHIWAENYNRSLDDIFAIQSEVAQAIAEKLHAVLLPEEKARIERRPTESAEAWDYFLQGRVQSKPDSILLLEKAVALDPKFAEAWASLAVQRFRRLGRTMDRELKTSAQYAFSQAERFGPGSPDVLWAKCFFNNDEVGNTNLADIEYLLEAMAIDPGFIDGRRQLAARYAQTGRYVEAQHHYEVVLRSDPFHPTAISQLATTYTLAGTPDKALDLLNKIEEPSQRTRILKAQINYIKTGNRTTFTGEFYDEGVEAAKAILERKYRSALEHMEAGNSSLTSSFIPGVGQTNTFSIRPEELLTSLLWYELGENKQWLVEAKKASTQLKEYIEIRPLAPPSFESSLALCYALQGERELMESTIASVREQTNIGWSYRQQVKCELHIAIAYLVLGDHDQAIETLEAASKMDGPIFLNRELDVWFIFDRLRGNPRFDALLKD